MPVTGGFRAMSLQEPRTLWGFSQALRQVSTTPLFGRGDRGEEYEGKVNE